VKKRPIKLTDYFCRAALVTTTILAGHAVSAQIAPPSSPSQPLASLKSVPIPQPENLAEFVQNKTVAIALGKSLFWDMQVGSDGVQSCASCHFHAGVDNRSKNQLHPGPDTVVNAGINYQLKPGNYPFHKLADPNNRSSTVISDTNDVAGSQGVVRSQFKAIVPGSAVDDATLQPDPIFNVGGIEVRQVTDRNTPSSINAVFNFRNFWDGRAQNEFNGVNPFGSRDPNATVIKATTPSKLQAVKISLKNSSAASQAVGPPLSAVEESATGRIFPDIGQKFGSRKKVPRETGKKLRALTPLGKQLVASTDSVLGNLSNGSQPGLKTSYTSLIKQAFKPVWWKSSRLINVAPDGTRTFVNKSASQKADTDGIVNPDQLTNTQFTLIDYNFSLFMGLAIQMYESTLVSDNSPFDQYMEGKTNALTTKQKQGKELFEGKAKCVNCHGGAEFTNASVKNVQNGKIERMRMGNGGVAVYDNGFYNIGVRPTQEDLGVGGKDPFGNPLSFTKYTQQQIAQGKTSAPILKAIPEEDIPEGALKPTERAAVDGAFKTPGLRNIELTAPYFHNGGTLTLAQVVDFYNRGGDFHEQNIDNLDADIQNLNLSAEERTNLVEFLKSLTDERVRKQSAPFDHPQLFIPNGHPGNTNSVTQDGTSGKAADSLLEIPAVGRNGGTPLRKFLAAS
jgi:cytochrome c peroxidase